MKICAVVPSLNPDEKLIDVITGLKEKGFEKIILVNDGSESDEYFVRLGNDKSVTVLVKSELRQICRSEPLLWQWWGCIWVFHLDD